VNVGGVRWIEAERFLNHRIKKWRLHDPGQLLRVQGSTLVGREVQTQDLRAKLDLNCVILWYREGLQCV
jgi:hypothetical protein